MLDNWYRSIDWSQCTPEEKKAEQELRILHEIHRCKISREQAELNIRSRYPLIYD